MHTHMVRAEVQGKLFVCVLMADMTFISLEKRLEHGIIEEKRSPVNEILSLCCLKKIKNKQKTDPLLPLMIGNADRWLIQWESLLSANRIHLTRK